MPRGEGRDTCYAEPAERFALLETVCVLCYVILITVLEGTCV